MLGTLVACNLLFPPRTAAYSVLAHEAIVDALWETGIEPLLVARFPSATPDDLTCARAYAYGGSVIQDLGYYPFGSRFFSNLLHYVHSGDFVEALIAESDTPDEYAFALGALAHYVGDNLGHPQAVNRAVAIQFPKLRAKFGDSVTYLESRSTHVIVEFSFDVVQAAGGAYLPDAYHRFIGFEVAKPLLERAFFAVYSLHLKEVFADEDLSIRSYRHAVSETLPEITRIAWRDKQEEIARLTPGVEQDAFVYAYTRQQFEEDFGGDYAKPGVVAKILGFFYKLLPKIGPLKPLQFKAPNDEAERLFTASFVSVRERFAELLDQVGDGTLSVPDTNYDTGEPSSPGRYRLADETHAEWQKRLSRK